MAEEPPELKEYVINKIGEDGQPFADKSSENYTGKAQVQYPNGDQYDGDFKNGIREGEGTMTYGETGNKYEGEWKNNMKDGIGKMTFGTKMKLVGDWFNGQIVKGKWIFANGTYFEGKFENNYPKGEGVWHFINGNVVKGEFTHEIKEIEAKGKEKERKEIEINWKSELEVDKEENYL